MRKDVTALLLSVLTVTLASGSAAQQLAPPDREITPLAGDLYRVREGQRYTVFLLTPDGIVMSDPLGRDTALWLKEEFANRFPSQPVRYVLHTSHRFERAEGATVFDAADRIGHRSFNSAVSESRRALDTPFDGLDRNHNNRLERTEWADAPWPP